METTARLDAAIANASAVLASIDPANPSPADKAALLQAQLRVDAALLGMNPNRDRVVVELFGVKNPR